MLDERERATDVDFSAARHADVFTSQIVVKTVDRTVDQLVVWLLQKKTLFSRLLVFMIITGRSIDVLVSKLRKFYKSHC